MRNHKSSPQFAAKLL